MESDSAGVFWLASEDEVYGYVPDISSCVQHVDDFLFFFVYL